MVSVMWLAVLVLYFAVLLGVQLWTVAWVSCGARGMWRCLNRSP